MDTHSDGQLTPVKEELLRTKQLLYHSLLPLGNSLFFNRLNPLAVKSTAKIVLAYAFYPVVQSNPY